MISHSYHKTVKSNKSMQGRAKQSTQNKQWYSNPEAKRTSFSNMLILKAVFFHLMPLKPEREANWDTSNKTNVVNYQRTKAKPLPRLIRLSSSQNCAKIGLKLVPAVMEANVNLRMVITNLQLKSQLFLTTNQRSVTHSTLKASVLMDQGVFSSTKRDLMMRSRHITTLGKFKFSFNNTLKIFQIQRTFLVVPKFQTNNLNVLTYSNSLKI